MYYPVIPQLKPFGWRDWPATFLILLMVLMNLESLIWFLSNKMTVGMLSALVVIVIFVCTFPFLARYEYKKVIRVIVKLGWGKEIKNCVGKNHPKRYLEIIQKVLEERQRN
jgi:hypothetical protein